MPSLLQPIGVSGAGVDLSSRIIANSTVTASPATNAETVVATIPAISSAVVTSVGVLLNFTLAFTVGTSGTAVQYRIRTGIVAGAGSVLFNSGATTGGIAAGNLILQDVSALDTAPTLPGASYCVTLTVTGGAATSTVSAVLAQAYII